MKTYVRNSAAWRRQKETQKNQRLAASKPIKVLGTRGKKYLYPERRDADGRLKEEYRK